jgi:hypothetical protein
MDNKLLLSHVTRATSAGDFSFVDRLIGSLGVTT